ncbi:MAG: beta-ketoacyl-ACP synthase II [Bacteroidales bacterium]|mgnify:CR=1 FL=1|jgi:3-oxoacyl-[acyl-carrier-protein] synthase II|nr:beta-ketoacyl-ACP synthase II [Bacteroidales bacterium]
MEARRVVITGTGIISPVGNDITAFWSAIKAGRCGIKVYTGNESWNLPVKVAGTVEDFDPAGAGIPPKDVRRNDRFCLFAQAAAFQAMGESGLEVGVNIEPERLGVYLGTGIGGMNTFIEQTKVMLEEGGDRVSPLFIPKMISNIAAGNIAIRYGAEGANLTTAAACASSTQSVGEAFRAVKAGYADAIIAGGTEAVLNPLAFGGFFNAHALSLSEDPLRASLPFSADRGGFVMAEGAAVLILEEYGHACRRGAQIIAELTGYGNNCDAYHPTAPRPDGVPAARAMSDALTQSGYRPGESLYINAHGTGTQLNDKAETKAIKLALGEEAARRVSISSTKSMTGHMIGAAGATEILVCALALRDGIIPPTIALTHPDPECDLDYTPLKAVERPVGLALSNSLGFGGHNACVALRKI